LAGSLEFGVVDEAIDDQTHLVAPSGEIDASTAPTLGRRLLALVDEGKTGLVVDLSRVTFLDSTALGVLLNAVRQLSSRRGQLVLVCPSDRVLRPFQITGLVQRLSITDSREEALGQLA
jgi:anti-sigma B factor antagonist